MGNKNIFLTIGTFFDILIRLQTNSFSKEILKNNYPGG